MRSPPPPPLPPWRPRRLHSALLLLVVAALAAGAGADDLASDARALVAFRDAVGPRLAWNGNRSSGRTPLNWDLRSSIALAAARGVAYIHSTSSMASHGNIKSSNVLLGKSYQARVSDNGLTTLVGPSSSPSRTTGYRAPEVIDSRKVSQKADVYSFGVLLLELVTGKAPSQAALNDEGVDLPRWVQSVNRSEWGSEVFDMELMRHQTSEEPLAQLVLLAMDCVAQVPEARPSMAHVVMRIEEIKKSSVASNIDQVDDQSSKAGSEAPPTNPFAT